MTKRIRIENADMGSAVVHVEIWDKTADGDKLVDTIPLRYPCDQTPASLHITNTRYLVIKEAQQ